MINNDFWNKSYTPVRFPRAGFTLELGDKIAFWGSCFARELQDFYGKFDLNSYASPFGIIYNPITMADSLSMLLNNELRGEPFYHSGLWRHDGFHSSCCFSGDREQKDRAMSFFTQKIAGGHEEILNTDVMIITLGTAYVYRKRETGLVVNNCHKQLNSLFQRIPYVQLSEKENSLLSVLNDIKKINGNLNVVLSVSPVRHLRDDARENSYSKALLRCLCEELTQEEYIHYFPSYEIILDELRDYRWYGQDLCHPSPPAVDYVMNRFFSWCAHEELLKFADNKKKERKHNSHRPLLKND